ncbi:MAG TPA: hypothetical protein VGG72_33230 [Bryobacteraceae bacterium]|jgi:hypothetical protein
MKFKLAFALPALFLLPLLTHNSPLAAKVSAPFQIHVVDADGHGIPGVKVSADGRIVCYTRSDGTVRWSETELMNRDVTFRFDHAGYGENSKILHVTQSGHAELTLRH